MSTRSVVFARTGEGLLGVYVHWDGHPSGRLDALKRLIERDGVEKVVSTLLRKPSGWSYITPDQTDVLGILYDSVRFVAVTGYGVEYSDEKIHDGRGGFYIQGDSEYRTPEDVYGDPFIEYIYVIEEDGSISWAENDYTKSWNHLHWHAVAA